MAEAESWVVEVIGVEIEPTVSLAIVATIVGAVIGGVVSAIT